MEVPTSRPQLLREKAEAILQTFSYKQSEVTLLGIRGYYKDSIGKPGVNDINQYDDAIFLISPRVFFAVNANVDPSKDGIKIAHLKAGGPYLYKIGMHNMKHPYKALRQYGNVTVLRNGIPVTDSPANRFYIDIHRGGYNTTSSLGCQTIFPDQWPSFLENVEREMKFYNQPVIPYYLAENI